MRKKYIAGNWKMNLERKSALALVSVLRERAGAREDVDIAVFPPCVYLAEVVRALEGSNIKVGAQNCCDQPAGAFTGEISAAMLADVGADAVILGHSERRHVYNEGDELINAKVRIALAAGLEVILCVGETLEERNGKLTEKVIGRQLTAGLALVAARELGRLTVAYEPVWAIGTGLNATPAQASAAHAYLRGVFAGMYQEAPAERLRIQYGGSVKPQNAREILSANDVDGCLVGGASIQAESFLGILESR
ncbi:MAG: triose-phosphate isomerase [Planctomycetes bacterium]|nr:triose-phosphate isomerase [Planctomycetota bacterium]